MATKTKVKTKAKKRKLLPADVRLIRKVLLGEVCPLWEERLLAARTVAACRRLWDAASQSERHTALTSVSTILGGRCLACEMSDAQIAGMLFKEYLTLVRAKVKAMRKGE